MKSLLSFNPKTRASIAMIALLIVGIGTVGMSGMLAVLHARTDQVDSYESAILRRVRQLNGRQLAREYMYQQVLPSESGAGGTFEISSNWGRITVGAWAESCFSTTTTGTVNQVGPSANGEPFVVPVDVDVFSLVNSGSWDTSSATDTYQFRIYGRNPALAGTVLGVQKSSNGVTANNQVDGSITANGRSYIWESDAVLLSRVYEFGAEQAVAPGPQLGDSDYQVSAPGGDPLVAKLMPDNTPFVAWLNNGVAGSVSNSGLLNVVQGPNANSMANFVSNNGGVSVGGTSSYTGSGISNNGLGSTFINLNVGSLPHVILDGAHTNVTFVGQIDSASEVTASTMNPVVVVIEGTLLSNITFVFNNSRPVVLGIKKGFGLGTVSLNFSDADSARMILVAEECPITVNTAGDTVTLKGGIVSDRDFLQSGGGSLVINQEDSPDDLENVAPRWLWVESYLQP